MLFNSLSFAAFLATVYFLFLLTPGRAKVWFLLLASYTFYGFTSLKACGILAMVSLVSFYGGHIIRRLEGNPKRQQASLFGLVTVLVLTLCFFKYFSFVGDFLGRFVDSLQSGSPDWISFFVPIGVSYYIFQAIGYIVDVYWGKERENKLTDFLLFMSFFPKVMMGPIERGEKLLPQIKELSRFQFSYDSFREGLLLFGWGLFKKLVVAERLSIYVNEVYGNPSDYGGITAIAATVFYALQIYADFSGYTDMALGTARLFHIRLTDNFNRPYYATTIQDFWRRWHLSLTLWLTDYVFTPLRMKLRTWGKVGLTISLFTLFILVGIWHGTGWTFIIFGALHGLYMTGSTLTLRQRDSFWKKRGQLGSLWLTLCRRLITFSMVVPAMVLFRAETATDAFRIFTSFFQGGGLHFNLNNSLVGPELMITLAAVVVMEVGELALRTPGWGLPQLLTRPLWLRWGIYTALVLGILCLGLFTNPQQFIYFAF